ncbi:hypothetical protein PUR57_02370 [Streptomyces sp. JV176]|uniref:hypothetical protein n=1 Tax=Streptomyces sp. JV176 TaxID=858630 RepID=UPI002E795C35|nr:hypothetical protein [Streptomyces sp. JV176]MEE1797540.1 hypothetical protein [Streptomyces sp. JV176]
MLAARIGAALVLAPAAGQATVGTEVYTVVETELVVEALAGTGRHPALTVTRIR